MAENWAAEQLSIYNDFVADGFDIFIRVAGDPGAFSTITLAYDDAADDTDTPTYGLKKNYDTYKIDGTIIRAGDVMVIVPAYGLSGINPSNRVVLPRATWDTSFGDLWDTSFDDSWEGQLEIVRVKTIEPGNVPLLYELQVRVLV